MLINLYGYLYLYGEKSGLPRHVSIIKPSDGKHDSSATSTALVTLFFTLLVGWPGTNLPPGWSDVSGYCYSSWLEREALPRAWCSSPHTHGLLGCCRTKDEHGTLSIFRTPPERKISNVMSVGLTGRHPVDLHRISCEGMREKNCNYA